MGLILQRVSILLYRVSLHLDYVSMLPKLFKMLNKELGQFKAAKITLLWFTHNVTEAKAMEIIIGNIDVYKM